MRARSLWAAGLLALLMQAPFGQGQSVGASDGPVRRIVPGDRLAVTVANDDSLSRIYPVLGDGALDMAYAGRVHVADMTPDGAASAIRLRLEQEFFRTADVRVHFSEYVQGAVTVMGAVNSPQRIAYQSEQMLTLTEVLIQAGWFTPKANQRDVRILRWAADGSMRREVISVDVQSMWDQYDFRNDHYLQPRDIVDVPDLGSSETSQEFLAVGEVGRFGFHPWRENMDMMRAIATIGYNREARLDSVRILRPDGAGGTVPIPVDVELLLSGNMAENRQIFAGDILYFPSAASARAGQVTLLGEIGNPGAVDLPLSGTVTLARLILARGGGTQFADLRRVRVLREAPDGSKQTLVHDVKEILDTGLFDQDVPLQDKDVVRIPSRAFGL